MTIKLYLINPRSASVNEYEALPIAKTERFGVARVGPLSLATVAGMAPEDFHIRICDEEIEPVDFGTDADVIGLSANVSQGLRAIEIAARFRALGKTTVLGGAHVSLAPELFEGRFDCLVVGELESIAAEFFGDMRAGTLQPRYVGPRTEMSLSPKPRWDLYRNERALTGMVQTSRGCPFSCEFCDVIQYLGRTQRHKPEARVIEEIQALYDLGYNIITLADDNFTAHRRRAKSLLGAMRDWNGRQGRDSVRFLTQVSIDIAGDDEMLRLCAEAGLSRLFIGVETINRDSLREVGKHQNLEADPVARIEKIVRRGLRVEASLMVGFDHDGLDIFERQYAFASSLPVANMKVSLLSAPVATPLFARMKAANRIVADDTAAHFSNGSLQSNMRPAQMSLEQLQLGAIWLISRLMHPEAFAERMRRIAEIMRPAEIAAGGSGRMYRHPSRAAIERAIARAVLDLAREDAEAGRAIRESLALGHQRPDIKDVFNDAVADYALRMRNLRRQGVYRPDLAVMAAPPFQKT